MTNLETAARAYIEAVRNSRIHTDTDTDEYRALRAAVESTAPVGIAKAIADRAAAKRAASPEGKVAADIEAAIAAGVQAVAGMADGGTCNLDSVTLRVARYSKPLEQACADRGIHLDRTSRGRTYNVVGGAKVGQGYRSTKFCEVVAKFLRDLGHDASVYYFTD